MTWVMKCEHGRNYEIILSPGLQPTFLAMSTAKVISHPIKGGSVDDVDMAVDTVEEDQQEDVYTRLKTLQVIDLNYRFSPDLGMIRSLNLPATTRVPRDPRGLHQGGAVEFEARAFEGTGRSQADPIGPSSDRAVP